MDSGEVQKLAKLARIEISEQEADKLSTEFEAILNYVGEVKKITNDRHPNSKEVTNDQHPILNTMREDEDAHEPGLYTEKLLNEAPEREGNYIRVKKIL